MSNIINADNGVVSGTPGLKYIADSSGIIQFQNNGTNSLQVDASQYVSATVNGLGQGLLPAEQYYRLNTALAGTQALTAQNIFGVGVTLVGSTVYQFESLIALSKTAGTTTHILSLLFGGSATINNISYNVFSITDTSTYLGVPPVGTITWGLVQTATATAFTQGQTNATQYRTTTIKGTVSINAGGTFIPQYQLSAAPGGAYTTAIGSYFKISPLGASGSNTSIGTWS